MDFTSNMQYQFTQNMSVLFQNNMSRMNSLYCREDLEQAIKAVRNAPADARPSRLHDLEVMCRQIEGLTANELLGNAALLESVPTREEVLDGLVDVIHDIYRSFPAPADYMERMVYNLAPEYQDDTVRTAILKRFVSGAGFHCKEYSISEIAKWAYGRMSPSEQKEYKSASETDKMELLLSKLDDSIFSKEHLEMELNVVETLKLLVKRMASCASGLDLRDREDRKMEFPGVQICGGTERLLEEYCEGMKLEIPPESSILERLECILKVCADRQAEDPGFVRLVGALETDMTEQMKHLVYKDKNGKNAKVIVLYRDNRRDKVKSLMKSWELLQICNELASGDFKMNGATRVNLYHFAIMFQMTIVLKNTDVFDEKTNIVKNLFEDYYNDNFMRYLNQTMEDKEYFSRFEKEPTGEGVNYKNYIEAIYLYYLYRTDLPLSPGQRIDKAVQLIKACVKEAASRRKSGSLPREAFSDYTDIYRELYVSEMVDLDEKSLLDYILGYYRVLPADAGTNGAGILVSSEESTAYDSVQEIMMSLEDTYSAFAGSTLAAAADEFMDDAKYGSRLFFDWKLAPVLCERFSDDADFVRVIKNLDDRLSVEFDWIGSRKKRFLANLLHLLYIDSSQNQPLMIDAVTKALKKNDVTINGRMVLDGVDILKSVGFDVGRETGQGGGRSRLWLNHRKYDDMSLNEVMEKVSDVYRFHESAVCKCLDEIFEQKRKVNKRISRTALIAVYLAYYVSQMEETGEIDSFPDIYEDFTASINPVLQESRYQPISEKNILDMYVILSLYYYMVENGR